MLSKEKLLAAEIERERVEILGDCVWVRGMTGTERDQWEQAVLYYQKKSKTESYDQFRASLVVRTVCDENGVRLFTDDEIAKVGAMPCAVVDKLYSVGASLSAVSQKDEEELGKNSMPDQS
jgi:hypothetical protein